MSKLPPPNERPLLVVGIAGGSGSGKTTVATALLTALNSQYKIPTSLLTMDFYYRDLSHLDLAQRAQVNFDHPNSIENELLIHHLRELKQGRSIHVPAYNFATHNRVPETKLMAPPNVLIVEGILLFADVELASLLDFKVFVDCDADIRFMRRLQRDVRERGRDVDSVCQQYSKTVRPMYNEFVAPSTRLADMIVPNSGEGNGYAAVVDLLACKARAFCLDNALLPQPRSASPRAVAAHQCKQQQTPPILLDVNSTSSYNTSECNSSSDDVEDNCVVHGNSNKRTKHIL